MTQRPTGTLALALTILAAAVGVIQALPVPPGSFPGHGDADAAGTSSRSASSGPRPGVCANAARACNVAVATPHAGTWQFDLSDLCNATADYQVCVGQVLHRGMPLLAPVAAVSATNETLLCATAVWVRVPFSRDGTGRDAVKRQ